MKSSTLSALALACFAAAPVHARLADAFLQYDGTNPSVLPATLSRTGLFDDAASPKRAVTAGIVAYEVNTPLWSDGARKERYIALPPGAKVAPTDSDQYPFPDKTIFVKDFSLDSIHGDSTSRFLVETRFLILRKTPFGNQYFGLSYKWHRKQDDADLVDPDAGLDTVHQVRLGKASKGQRWRYPSQGDCTACHFNRGILGFLTPQLNRPSKADANVNQLQALVAAGVLSANPLAGKTGATFRWAAATETGTPPAGLTLAEWKARSFLAANCSQCHGNKNANSFESASHNFDFFNPGKKIDIASDKNGGFVGKASNLDPRFPQLVYRGYPESSLVLARMVSRPTANNPVSLQMPPLATYQMDSAEANAMKDWICSLGTRGSACKMPVLQPDSTYWTTSLPGHAAFAMRPAPRALLRGHSLLLTGSPGASPVLFDGRGKRIGLTRVGMGEYRVAEALRPGVYLLRTGAGVLTLPWLPR